MKKTLLILFSCVIINTLDAQDNNYWSLHTSTDRVITDKAVARQTFPQAFELFDLNVTPFAQQLFSVTDNRSSHSTIINLPNADGQIEQFEIVEASNFDPALQARFPEIRAFSGRGVSDKSATLKLSLSPLGIQTMVFRAGKETEFMEPYSENRGVYVVYKRTDRSRGQMSWICSTPELKLIDGLNQQVTARSGGDLKTLRLAQSVTAEYSNYFGATSSAQVSLVLAAINNTLTRCNGVYEKDLALHLNLIPQTTNVIYYNPSTDPYSPATQTSQWNNQLQNTLTSVIGEANYDIGHLFGASGGGGNAGCIGCVCVDGSKGKGYTSPADGIPQGDNFDIDYVVHEVGHQLGANHTFSQSNEGTGVNKEPGSGITIMGYAGITSYDLAPHSIDIFHQASIAQIQANLLNKTCPVTYVISNSTPVVGALSNYTIPISTPFALTGSATDADPGDLLTYCWEQNDNSTTTGSGSVASPTKTTGPNWISFSPTQSPTRYFPRLSTILAGANVTGPLPGGDAGANTEALSSVSRTLNFRLTVRDNAPYSSTSPYSVGQTQFRDMVVTVTSISGPFVVTMPNSAITWEGGSSQTVTWNVANTTASPVSCSLVKILLSTDGGQTFPTVLVESTANDGSALVTIPNTTTNTARIKVESIGNVFFDISNANFTIGTASACSSPSALASSAITTSSATVSWSPVTGANSYDVDYKLNSSGTWTNAATATTATSVNLGSLASGSLYDWRVRANCTGSSSNYSQAQFTTTSVSGGCPGTYDVSTNGTVSGAAQIPFNTDIKGLINPAGDNDYYKMVISTSGTATITLSTLPADYDLIVYKSNGKSQVASSQNGGTTNESISRTFNAGTYYIRVYGYQNANNATNCYTLRVQTGTASRQTDLIVENKMNVYPNPVSKTLTISLPNLEGAADIRIFDIYGKQVIQRTAINKNIPVDVSSLPAGVYLVKWMNREQENTVKFIKE